MPKIYSPAAIEKAAAWCSRIPASAQTPSSDFLDPLLRIPEIDPGEAFLFALAAETNSVVATGDRKACAALNASRNEIGAALRGKVICLETALWLLLDRIEYERLAGALVSELRNHRTIRILFSRGEETPEQDFREALKSYSTELEQKVGSLLFATKRPGARHF